MLNSLNLRDKIKKWEVVSSAEEYEKYFRYKCFQIKFIKALNGNNIAVRRKGYELLETWCEAGLQGKDVASSIIETLESEIDSHLREALIFAVKAISDRNLSMLSEKEIEEAEETAKALYKEALEDIFEGVLE